MAAEEKGEILDTFWVPTGDGGYGQGKRVEVQNDRGPHDDGRFSFQVTVVGARNTVEQTTVVLSNDDWGAQ